MGLLDLSGLTVDCQSYQVENYQVTGTEETVTSSLTTQPQLTQAQITAMSDEVKQTGKGMHSLEAHFTSGNLIQYYRSRRVTFDQVPEHNSRRIMYRFKFPGDPTADTPCKKEIRVLGKKGIAEAEKAKTKAEKAKMKAEKAKMKVAKTKRAS